MTTTITTPAANTIVTAVAAVITAVATVNTAAAVNKNKILPFFYSYRSRSTANTPDRLQ